MNILYNNPFHELFVTDSATGEDFVEYFSPFFVPHALELFREGNVVLKGTQGCGKSMLLKLFQPEVRLAYAAAAAAGKSVPFPVPEDLCDFIGAGVNLSKSGLLDIIQMLPADPSQSDFQDLTAYFTDFLNYWLFRDLLNSVHLIASNPAAFNRQVKSAKLDEFAAAVSSEESWFGYLTGCETFEALRTRVNERVITYRRWLARNQAELPESIRASKTSIGEVLSRAVVCLKQTGVIHRRVKVFLRIDQLEELWHRGGNQATLSSHFRQVINRAIGNRDLRVSFRLGTRRYSWDHDLSMPSGRKLEEVRDYLTVDIDQSLRRNEDRSTGWLFEGFAADVFAHRLAASGPPLPPGSNGPKLLRDYFGPSPTWPALVEQLIATPPEDPQKLLKMDGNWSVKWRRLIESVYDKEHDAFEGACSKEYAKDPFNALLLATWGLQTGGGTGNAERRRRPPPETIPPWTKWWYKERGGIAAMQLVVRHQQILFWWGSKKVLSLSASNITLFLSICREIWDQWLRRNRDASNPALRRSAPTGLSLPIDWKVQAVAIDNASKNWHRNFSRQPGRPGGDVRMRFVDQIGAQLRRGMVNDLAMSYPGGNGFSLKQSEIANAPELARLLSEAVGWGDLYEVDHTTKIADEKHRDPRRKYYLNPILSPHYQITDVHTKEPVYTPIEVIIELAKKAKALSSTFVDAAPKRKGSTHQGELDLAVEP